VNWLLEPLDGPVADTLDLHGMTWSQAEPAVVAFLNRIRKRQRGALVQRQSDRSIACVAPAARTLTRTAMEECCIERHIYHMDGETRAAFTALNGMVTALGQTVTALGQTVTALGQTVTALGQT
jgi:hypothetical protein